METVVAKSKLGDLLTALEQPNEFFFSGAKRSPAQQAYVTDTITQLLGLADITQRDYEGRRDAYRAKLFGNMV
jgi:hypothetical protein